MTPRFSRRRTLIRLLFRRGGVIIGPRAADFIRASRSIHTDVPRKYNVISMPDIELREVEFDIEGPIVAVTESEAVDRHLSQTRAN